MASLEFQLLVGVHNADRGRALPQGWDAGPLAEVVGVSSTEDERRDYLLSRAADVVYGGGALGSYRLSHVLPHPVQCCARALHISALELVGLSDASDRTNRWVSAGGINLELQVLIVHGQLHGTDQEAILDMLREIRLTPNRLLEDPALQAALPGQPQAIEGRYTFSIVLSVIEGSDGGREQTLWELCAALPFQRLQPSAPDLEAAIQSMISPSSDWSILVLRDGAGIVVDRSAGAFIGQARAYAAAIYTDILVLGMLQRLMIDRLVEAGARVSDTESLALLELTLARARNHLWWTEVSVGETGNRLLRAYHTQHSLPAVLDQLTLEIQHYASVMSARRDARTNLALGILAVFGVPLAVALQVWSVMFPHWPGLVLALVFAGAFASASLVFFPGLRDLFRWSTGRIDNER